MPKKKTKKQIPKEELSEQERRLNFLLSEIKALSIDKELVFKELGDLLKKKDELLKEIDNIVSSKEKILEEDILGSSKELGSIKSKINEFIVKLTKHKESAEDAEKKVKEEEDILISLQSRKESLQKQFDILSSNVNTLLESKKQLEAEQKILKRDNIKLCNDVAKQTGVLKELNKQIEEHKKLEKTLSNDVVALQNAIKIVEEELNEKRQDVLGIHQQRINNEKIAAKIEKKAKKMGIIVNLT